MPLAQPEESKQSKTQGLIGEIENQIERLENKLAIVLKEPEPAKEGQASTTKLIGDLLRIKSKLAELVDRIEL